MQALAARRLDEAGETDVGEALAHLSCRFDHTLPGDVRTGVEVHVDHVGLFPGVER